MYHPAAALRTPEIERTSYADMASVPATLLASRARREQHEPGAASAAASGGAADDLPAEIPRAEVELLLDVEVDASARPAPQLGLF
jgi:hypothetical protein